MLVNTTANLSGHGLFLLGTNGFSLVGPLQTPQPFFLPRLAGLLETLRRRFQAAIRPANSSIISTVLAPVCSTGSFLTNSTLTSVGLFVRYGRSIKSLSPQLWWSIFSKKQLITGSTHCVILANKLYRVMLTQLADNTWRLGREPGCHTGPGFSATLGPLPTLAGKPTGSFSYYR